MSKRDQFVFDSSRRVGPFVAVSRDEVKDYGNGAQLRFILAGGYDAFGLIGPEFNGVAILDQTKRMVVCDRIAQETTGYFGPSERQVQSFEALLEMEFEEVQDFLSRSPNTRYIPQATKVVVKRRKAA